jgi:hypothetical protein
MTIQITNSAIANPATDATPAELAEIRALLGIGAELTEAEGSNVKIIVSGAGTSNASDAAAAESNRALLQAALDATGRLNLVTPGDIWISDTLFIPDAATVFTGARTKIKVQGAVRKSMATTLNAHWTGDAPTPNGVAILGATDQPGQSGIGTVRFAIGPQRLFYTAPGDTEGTAVNVSASAADPLAAIRYELVSANGRRLYVTVAPNFLPAGAASGQVRVHSNAGWRNVTWTRDAATCTVTFPAPHGRSSGDAIGLGGGLGPGQTFIRQVTSDIAFTFDDTRGAGSGTAAIMARGGATFSGTGEWDFGITAGVPASGTIRSVNDAHAVFAVCANRFSWNDTLIRNPKKYGIYAQVTNHFSCDFPFYADVPVVGYAVNYAYGNSTAAIQLQGCNNNSIFRATGKSTDTLTAMVSSDYPQQALFLPQDFGRLNTKNTIVNNPVGEDCYLDIVRLAGAVGCSFINTLIDRPYARVVSNTTRAVVSGFCDYALVGNTNTAGECVFEGLTIRGATYDVDDLANTSVCRAIRLKPAGTRASSGIFIDSLGLGSALNTSAAGAIELVGESSLAVGLPGLFTDVTITGTYNREQTTWQGFLCSPVGTITIDSLNINRNTLAIKNDTIAGRTGWTSGLLLLADANITIESLTVQNNYVSDVSDAGVKAYGVRQVLGTVKVGSVLDNTIKNGNSALSVEGGNTGSKWTITGGALLGSTTYGGTFASSVDEVRFGGIALDNATVGAPINIANTTGNPIKVRGMGGMGRVGTNGNHVRVNAGAVAPDVDGADIRVNTTLIAGVTGNLVKSSATGRTVMFDGAAWTSVA